MCGVSNVWSCVAFHVCIEQVLEEWNFVNETMSYHGNSISARTNDSLQTTADSSQEEEVKAICSRHGVKDTDTLAKKLKALDTVRIYF